MEDKKEKEGKKGMRRWKGGNERKERMDLHLAEFTLNHAERPRKMDHQIIFDLIKTAHCRNQGISAEGQNKRKQKRST